MVAPGGFESMTTRPFVSMAGSAGGVGGIAGFGVPGGSPSAGAPGSVGGARIVLIASMRTFTVAASAAVGSASRYFWKNSPALSNFCAFSYDTAALNKNAGKDLRA